MTHKLLPSAALVLAMFANSCTVEDAEDVVPAPVESSLTGNQRTARYGTIRDAARTRGVGNAFLLAGIANTETGLAQCWSEATWACQGPNSPDCGGGPVIAGSADGPCGDQQGGLGMFQFDAGTYAQTINRYGQDVLTVDGQIGDSIDYVVNMVKLSAYTTNAETDAKARAWINAFDVSDAALRDQWIKTVLRYYNGCQPGWSCWAPRYQTYSDGMQTAINEVGGIGYWSSGGSGPGGGSGGGTRCGDSPATVGLIDVKYQQLGGCGSVLGAPVTEERGSADGVGRYSDFQRGSIYWTPAIGAYEVHGLIHDKWAALGWETGDLGYPTSDEHAVAGGRRSDFEHGSINWNASTGQVTVALAAGPRVLDIDFQIQETGYWCGPAAAHNTLSARIAAPSQQTLATELGTTTNGTDWIGQVTATLNAHLPGSPYVTTEMPNDPPTQAQRDRLWSDIVVSIDNHYAVVTNIVAPPSNHPPGYPTNRTIFHYFTVIGYNPGTGQVLIADSANFSGNTIYWLSFSQLATLIPPKGYSAYRP